VERPLSTTPGVRLLLFATLVAASLVTFRADEKAAPHAVVLPAVTLPATAFPSADLRIVSDLVVPIEPPIEVDIVMPDAKLDSLPIADPAPVAVIASVPVTDAVPVAAPLVTPAVAPPPTERPATPPPTTAPVVAPVMVSVASAELRTLALMNSSRAQAGAGPLMLDAGVSGTARAHSAAESRAGYVYHDGPDGTARSRDGAACGNGWYGENTGKVWGGNVDALHSEFMAEPLVPINHHTNIVDPSFKRVGIGAVQGPDALYLTMVFCR
jgi:uncharacterized protein YkwD